MTDIRIEWLTASTDCDQPGCSGGYSDMGIFSIDRLKEFRGYFVVLAFIIAAIVTPPDVVSQLALAVPMCLLYEMGIWAAQLFIRQTKVPDEDPATPSS